VSFRILFCTPAIALLVMLAGVPAATEKAPPAAVAFQRKLDRLQANGRMPHPDQTPTVMSEQEINAYLASGKVELPAGVKSVKLKGTPGSVTGTVKVDFDQLRSGRYSANPLLSIFSGTHEVLVETHAHGRGGEGYVHVDSVALDGIEVPQFVLQIFVEKYLQPKYPQIGIDSRFNLPVRIDSAVVGWQQLTVVQK
jgi:hypothetical protein